jgi:hypothetical protein
MRAALRISTRSIRRHPWRSVVVVALVMVPVAVLSGFLAAMAGIDERQAAQVEDSLHGAQVLLPVENVNSPLSEAAMREKFGLGSEAKLTLVTGGSFARERSDGYAEVRAWLEADWSQRDAQRATRLLDGRWPAAPGEVAVVGAARSIGSSYEVALPATSVKVVGRIAAGTWAFGPIGLIAAPSTFPPFADPVWTSANLAPPTPLWRVSGLDDATLSRVNNFAAQYVGSSTIKTQLASVGVSVFGFTWCGLIAASALAIGARRRRRELGLLSATGATPRQLRGAVVADGLVLGGVGAVLGLGLGLAGSAWWNDVGLHWFGRGTGDGWRVTPLVMAAPLLGWLSAVLAGFLAGRGVSTQPTVDLLAGRAPRPARAPRWLGIGVAAVGGSFTFGVLAAAIPSDGKGRPVASVASAAFGVIALIAVSVGLIAMLPELMVKRGLTLRTASKDLVRFGARTTGATAAIALTLSGATFAAIGERQAAASEELNRSGQVEAPWSVALVSSGRQRIRDGRLVDPGLTPREIEEIARRSARSGDSTTVVTIADGVARACLSKPLEVAQQFGGAPLLDSEGCLQVRTVLVPAAEFSSFDEVASNALRSGRLVGAADIDPNLGGTATLRVGDTSTEILRMNADGAPVGPKSALVEAVTSGSFGTVLVPEQAWTPDLERAAIRQVAIIDPSDPGLIEPDKFVAKMGFSVQYLAGSGFSTTLDDRVVWGAGAAIVLVCLLVLTLALVLVRIESQDEERVLSTQGATQAVIARICGWRAVLVTVTAAVPAVVLTLLYTWIVFQRFWFPHVISLAMLLIGMPLLAGAVFGVSGLRRSRPPVTTV